MDHMEVDHKFGPSQVIEMVAGELNEQLLDRIWCSEEGRSVR